MNKPVFCLALALVSTTGMAAEPSKPAVERLVDCADVKDSRERLTCFDREVAPLVIARAGQARSDTPQVVRAPNPAVTPAPAAAPSTLPVPAPNPPRSFGEEQLTPKPRAAGTEDDQTLHASIERLRKGNSGQFIVYLDNGQAWRHEDQVQGEFLREGEAITISKGALGSYRLARDAGKAKNWIRVTRIR